jgi:hypothetical protein
MVTRLTIILITVMTSIYVYERMFLEILLLDCLSGLLLVLVMTEVIVMVLMVVVLMMTTPDNRGCGDGEHNGTDSVGGEDDEVGEIVMMTAVTAMIMW